MRKIGIFVLMISIFATTFFVSNKLSAQVTQPLPTIGLKPIKSIRPGGEGFFGGSISNKKASKIISLEDSGYICEYSENTIQVRNAEGSQKAPTEYYIENYLLRKNNHPIKKGQAIIGSYKGTIDIECVKYNEDGTESRETVTLSKIKRFLTTKSPVKY